jgi:glutamate decarboxylase
LQVRSINVSSHKFGLVQPGIGFIIWRLRSLLPEEMIFHINYLGGDEMSVGLNFSRSASGAINQYYNFLRLGRKGYTAVIQELMNLKKYIAKAVSEIDDLEVVGTEEGVPLVAFRIKNPDDFDFTEFDVSKRLKEHSWLVPAYTLPANAESISILRVVIREGMSFDLCSRFVSDLKEVMEDLQSKARAQPHASNQHPRC